MKGVKIGLKEVIIIFLTLIILMQFLGFFIAGSIIVIIITLNAYLRYRDIKTKNNNSTENKEVIIKEAQTEHPKKEKRTNKNKLILPAVILLVGLILGGFYCANQTSKQESNKNLASTLPLQDSITMQGQALVAGTSPVREDPMEGEGVIVYEVQKGDTLNSIAIKYKTTPNTILWANAIDNADSISPGDKLFILPVSGVTYTVKQGDNIDQIAEKYKSTRDKIIAFNELPAKGDLTVGDQIVIPDGQKELLQNRINNNNYSDYVENNISDINTKKMHLFLLGTVISLVIFIVVLLIIFIAILKYKQKHQQESKIILPIENKEDFNKIKNKKIKIKFSLDKFLKIIIVAGGLLVALSVAYYLVIYIPYKDKMKIERENQAIEQEKQTREDCYKEARYRAKNLLLNKIQLKSAQLKNETNPFLKEKFAREISNLNNIFNKELVLNDDFNKFYEDCLSKSGLNK